MGRGMHFAKLKGSPRLQRLHDVLNEGDELSTLDLAVRAQVVNPATYISELRANGAVITCRQGKDPKTGNRIWRYRMLSPVPDPPDVR